MRHIAIFCLAAAAFVIGAWNMGGENLFGEPPAGQIDQNLKPIMKRKLDYAKAILESLATEDFDGIAKNAQALSLLSLESEWQVLTTEEYLEQSADFRRSLQVVREAGQKKNIDRSALGYVDMTIRCVECHKYLRQNSETRKSRTIGE